nr:MAG TPA: hypothetical protein [Caudoviricetes sp.]
MTFVRKCENSRFEKWKRFQFITSEKRPNELF